MRDMLFRCPVTGTCRTMQGAAYNYLTIGRTRYVAVQPNVACPRHAISLQEMPPKLLVARDHRAPICRSSPAVLALPTVAAQIASAAVGGPGSGAETAGKPANKIHGLKHILGIAAAAVIAPEADIYAVVDIRSDQAPHPTNPVIMTPFGWRRCRRRECRRPTRQLWLRLLRRTERAPTASDEITAPGLRQVRRSRFALRRRPESRSRGTHRAPC